MVKSKVVELLSDYGASLGSPPNNKSAVFIAARKGSIDILKILVRYGIDVTISDGNGNTIAHHAAYHYNGYLMKPNITAMRMVSLIAHKRNSLADSSNDPNASSVVSASATQHEQAKNI